MKNINLNIKFLLFLIASTLLLWSCVESITDQGTGGNTGLTPTITVTSPASGDTVKTGKS